MDRCSCIVIVTVGAWLCSGCATSPRSDVAVEPPHQSTSIKPAAAEPLPAANAPGNLYDLSAPPLGFEEWGRVSFPNLTTRQRLNPEISRALRDQYASYLAGYEAKRKFYVEAQKRAEAVSQPATAHPPPDK